VARLTLAGLFPAFGTRAARVYYADGRQGSGLPVENAVSFLGNTVAPALGECAFELRSPSPANLWRTYDCQGDGQMDISDAVCHLNFLFLGGPAPGCAEAMDFNGDGGRDISDPVAELNFLFLGGSSPMRGTGCQVYSTCAPSAHCP
jgi:hypothetical protein